MSNRDWFAFVIWFTLWFILVLALYTWAGCSSTNPC